MGLDGKEGKGKLISIWRKNKNRKNVIAMLDCIRSFHISVTRPGGAGHEIGTST